MRIGAFFGTFVKRFDYNSLSTGISALEDNDNFASLDAKEIELVLVSQKTQKKIERVWTGINVRYVSYITLFAAFLYPAQHATSQHKNQWQ